MKKLFMKTSDNAPLATEKKTKKTEQTRANRAILSLKICQKNHLFHVILVAK